MPTPEDRLTHEQIAELDVLLAPERPVPSAAFTTTLDARVAARFAGPRPASSGARRSAPSRRAWLHGPRFAALVTTAAVALVGLVLVGEHPSSRSVHTVDAPGRIAQTAEGGAQAPGVSPASSGAAATSAPQARKVQRSAELALGAPRDRVDEVARGVFATVADLGGIVASSDVSSGSDSDGSASFSLRIPSGRLELALGRLSQLPHVRVSSRSDSTLDVTGTFVSLRRRLASAQAEHAALLRLLRAATSDQQALTLQARIDALDRAIAAIQQSQAAAARRVAYSRLELTIDPEDGTAGGLTLGRGLRDAGHVLRALAAAIVIAGAALLPFALLGALAFPLVRLVRRRRREQLLDIV